MSKQDTESQHDDGAPDVFVDFLGAKRRVCFDIQAAKLFGRLCPGKSLLQKFNPNDADQFAAFLVAGLKRHNPDIVGDVDMRGNPDEKTKATIDKIDALDLDTNALGEVLAAFLEVYFKSRPKPSEDSRQKKAQAPTVDGSGLS